MVGKKLKHLKRGEEAEGPLKEATGSRNGDTGQGVCEKPQLRAPFLEPFVHALSLFVGTWALRARKGARVCVVQLIPLHP